MRRCWYAVCAFLSVNPITADDSLFLGAEDKVVEEAPPSEMLRLFEGPQPLKITAKTTLDAGVLYGWEDYGQSGSHREGAVFNQYLYLDARPYRNLGTHATLLATYPATSSAVTLSELYLDTVVAEAVFVRVGRYTASWGSAKIFNIVDLATDSSRGLMARASWVFTGGSFVWLTSIPVETGFDYTSNSTYEGTSWNDAVQAARFNLVGSGYDAHVAWRYRPNDPILKGTYKDSSMGLKLTFGGLDVFDDLLIQIEPGEDPRASTVAGFFFEIPFLEGRKEQWQIYGEYQYDRTVKTVTDDHQVSLALKLTGMPNNAETGAQWSHSWHDGTGQVLFGYAFDAEEGMRVKLGIPCLYGSGQSPGTYFTEGQDLRIAGGLKLEIVLVY